MYGGTRRERVRVRRQVYDKLMKLKGSDIFRLCCISALWLLLCVFVVASQPFTLRVLFIVVASGIIVFVPLYKKYVREQDTDKSDNAGGSR